MTKPVSEILASNLLRLMEVHKPELGSQSKIADKTKIGQRTVGRALNGEGSARLDSLEAIARAFKLKPWELLHPDLATKLPHQTKQPSPGAAVKEPFALYSVDPDKQSLLLQLFDQLTRAQQDDFLKELTAAVASNEVIIREVGARLRHQSDEEIAKHLPAAPKK